MIPLHKEAYTNVNVKYENGAACKELKTKHSINCRMSSLQCSVYFGSSYCDMERF